MKINEYKIKQFLEEIKDNLGDGYDSQYNAIKDKIILVTMAKIETLLDLIEFEEQNKM